MKGLRAFFRRFRSRHTKRDEDVITLSDQGIGLAQKGRTTEAIETLSRAASMRPDTAAVWSNLGMAFMQAGQIDEACESFSKASQCKDVTSPVFDNWGGALTQAGRLEEALTAHKQALTLDPTCASALCNLGNTYRAMGRLDDARMSLDAAVRSDPNDAGIASARLYTLNFIPGVSNEDLAQAHSEWPGAQLDPAVHFDRNRDPNRRLRIGYLSTDFRVHSCAHFLLPLVESHNRDDVHVTLFSGVSQPDAVTAQFQEHCDQWVDVAPLSAVDLVNTVRSQSIDVLVDCNGHTASSKLAAFRHRMAPVQVSWLGYPATTGLKAMDAHISDTVATPSEFARCFSEDLIALPLGFHTYRPLAPTPDCAAPPSVKNGFVTFGAFNNVAKMSDDTLRLWSGVLHSVPGSRLLIKANSFQDPFVESAFRSRSAQCGLPNDRVDILPWQKTYGRHYADLQNVDIILDTLPYNGTTTTCDALWMGVPVVTAYGSTPAGRVGASLLAQVGHEAWVGRDPDAYAGIAQNLAENEIERVNLMSRLREQMVRSALGDGTRFALQLEDAYKSLWQVWCARQIS